MKVVRVAAVGECMLELHEAGATWHLGLAGDTFNTLWTMRALLPPPAETDFITAFGDEVFSSRQRDFMSSHGIGTANSPLLAGERPGLYAITLEGHERHFTYWRADAAARKLAENFESLERSLADRDLIFFSGITLAILSVEARKRLLRAIAAARTTKALVAFDSNYRARLWSTAAEARSAIEQALAVVDIALPSFSDEKVLFGDRSSEDTIDRIRRMGVQEVVVKDGTNAALAWTGDSIISVPTSTDVTPVDTAGAGDAFNGAYLCARLRNAPAIEAIQSAHRAGGEATRHRGALVPMEALRMAVRGERVDQ